MDGDWNSIQNALKAERARPAYKLGIRYEQPGIFYLGFVLRSTPARENFSVLPSGYYYRKKVIFQPRSLLAQILFVYNHFLLVYSPLNLSLHSNLYMLHLMP